MDQKGKRATQVNMAFSLIYMASGVASSFVLVPIITSNMGISAYGYIGLGSAFINIASVASIAVTSMSTRYILVSINDGTAEISKLFNSILLSCVVLSFIIVCFFLFIVAFLPSLISVEESYAGQVRIMFLLMAGSLSISVVSTPFLSAQYQDNNLIPFYAMMSISQLSRVILPLILFPIIGPSLFLPYAASFVVDVLSLLVYIQRFKKVLPGIPISLFDVRLSKIKEVLSSGVWVTVTKIGTVLFISASTYLSSLLIGPLAVGLYSSFVQLQSLFTVLTNALVPSFVPMILKSYASGDQQSFMSEITKYSKLLSIIVGACAGVALIYAVPFFSLWLGSPVNEYGDVISVMIVTAVISNPLEVMHQGFIARNTVKLPALATVFFGIVNVVLAIILTSVFDMGLMGIVLAQAIACFLRMWGFVPLYFASGKRRYLLSLYAAIVQGVLVFIASGASSLLVSLIFPQIGNWLMLIMQMSLSLLIACLIALLFYGRQVLAEIRCFWSSRGARKQ